MASISPAIPIVPASDGLDYVYTQKDFEPLDLLFPMASVSQQSKTEMDKIWESIEGFVFDECFATQFNFDSERQGLSQATSVLLSCKSVADLSLLFRERIGDMVLSVEPLHELLSGSPESPFYKALKEEEIKIMVAVCVYGAIYGQWTNAIGKILQGCYSCGVLDKPAISDSDTYLIHIKLIVIYSCYFNRIHALQSLPFDTAYVGPPSFETSSYTVFQGLKRNNGLEGLFSGRSLKAILGLSVTDLYRILHLADSDQHSDQATDAAVGDTFRVDDLNVKAIRSLGKIRVVWTLSLEKHLLLDLARMTLYIVWHVPALPAQSFIGRWDKIACSTIDKGFCGSSRGRAGVPVAGFALSYEVNKTWAILFATDAREKNRKEDYKFVDDEELTKNYRIDAYEQMETYNAMREIHLDSIGSLGFREREGGYKSGAFTKELIPYAQFPIFETRLRQLRFYMDSQKPRGIRQLWKDKRDTLNYYTFWGVIIFGFLSIFLAFFSLAVSIAQTVASFKALNAS
ncbi:hypothetical protein BKA61DRAFT_181952 [Leptodontidium sp. MPI-SDFR-AT-0119]|nr:hypothetical protein BKA61DRAFT_181952 [Leptodontidium sp. MPI-SDFR-AT-0119]